MRHAASLLLGLTLIWLTPPPAATAESKLLLPYPPDFGTFPATTYDADGKGADWERLGDAVFAISERPDGTVHLLLESQCTEDRAQ